MWVSLIQPTEGQKNKNNKVEFALSASLSSSWVLVLSAFGLRLELEFTSLGLLGLQLADCNLEISQAP